MSDAEVNATTPTSSHVQQPQSGGRIAYLWKIPLDKSFILSFISFFQVGAMVLSLIALICVASGRSENCDDSYSSTYNFFEFVAISAFLSLMTSWIFYAVTLPSRIFFSRVPWLLVDLAYNSIYIVFYFIGSAVLAAQSCDKDSNKAGSAFGFMALLCFCVIAFLQFFTWRTQRRGDATGSVQSPQRAAPEELEKY